MAINALDLLLGGKLNTERPTKAVKIVRLSTDEVEFVLTATALTMEDFKHLQETNTGKDGKIDDVGLNLDMVTRGIKEFDGRLNSNKEQIAEIKKTYNVSNMQKFVNMMFLPGEIAMLVMEITNISGFNEDMVAEVKKG